MPELPEVETVVRELKSLEGKFFSRVVVHWDRTIEGSTVEFLEQLRRKQIAVVFRRGKYICIELNTGDRITIHLRMTGKCIFEPSERDRNYSRVEFIFSDRSTLYFVDTRKFGRIKWWPKQEEFLSQLGPEPLESEAVLKAFLSCKSNREVKKVLLDQAILAGVGNIYADESLFLARIHPMMPFVEVSRLKLKRLAETIPVVMRQAIENMGTTLSDYRNTKNMGGENQNYLKAYGQTGEPCCRCKTKIEKIVIGQRGTHFCPRCQTL